MSKTVDERIVSMQFDNSKFEKNVSTTMGTLDKLKKALKLDGASKGLQEVQSATRKLDMAPLSNGVEKVGLKFSALWTIADQTLRNITNSVEMTAKKLVSAFTIDPIKSGFQEYETQIGAVQTILANTSHDGTNLQQVNAALDELNTYADKTIYNFTEMTRNIGTFTAAGVNLRTSVDSIKGIANLAAVSGSTSQQASTAMYQLSQALAAGKVNLMDWNSVVNAGMGGKVFQDALVRTSELLKTGAKDAISTSGSFRESLTKTGWLTTEVLTETLKQFAGTYSEADLIAQGFTESQAKEIAAMAVTAEDAATKVKTFTQLFDTLKEAAQSGWTQSWEIIIGDFGEAKNLLTDMSNTLGDIIGKSADARNKMLSGGLSSGWKQLLNEGIADEAGYIDSLVKAANNGKAATEGLGGTIISLSDKMSKMSEEELEAAGYTTTMTNEFKLLAEGLKDGTVSIDDLAGSLTDADTWATVLHQGLKDGTINADTMSQAVFDLSDKMSNMSAEELKAAGYTSDMVDQIKTLGSGLKDGTVSMDEFVEKINRPSGRENLIQALWNSFNALMAIITPVKEAFRDIFPATTGDQLYSFTEKVRDLTKNFSEFADRVGPQIYSTFKGIFSVIDIGVTFIKELGTGIVRLIGNFTGLGEGALDVTASVGDMLSGFRDSIKGTDIFGKAIDKVVSFLQKGIDKVKEFINFAKEKISFPSFDGFLGVLQGIWNFAKKIGSIIGKLGSELATAFTNVFRNGDLSSGMDLINGGIFASILLSVKKIVTGIGDIFKDSSVGVIDKIGDTLEKLSGVFDSVGDSLKTWQQNLKADTLTKIAIAIAVLAGSLVLVSMINPDKLSSSLGGITILLANLMGAMAIFDKFGGDYKRAGKAAVVMVGMSAAILIMAGALKTLSGLNIGELLIGLTGIVGLTAIILAATYAFSKIDSKKIMKGATQLVIFALAIKIMASSLMTISGLSWDELGKGLVGMTGIVGMLVAAAKVMDSNNGHITKFAGQMVILSLAVGAFSLVGKYLSTFSWDEMAKGGAGILGLVAILVAAAKVMDSNNGHITKFAGQMILMSAAVGILARIGTKISSLGWEAIAKAGAGILGLVTMLVAASKIMSNGSTAKGAGQMLIIAAAIAVLAPALMKFSGLSWEEIGKGLVTLGGAIFILAAGLEAMTGSLSGSAALLIAAASLAILTPVLVTLGNLSWASIVKGLVTIAAAFAVLGVAGVVLGSTALVILAVSAALGILGLSCLAIGAGLMMAGAGVVSLAAGLAAGATAIVASITVIITGIIGLVPAIVQAIGNAIIVFCETIAASASSIGNAIKTVILELIDVLVTCVPELTEGMMQLIIGVLDALIEYGPQIVSRLVQVFVQFIGLLSEYAPELITSLVGFILAVINGISEHIPELLEAAVTLLSTLLRGIVDALGSLIQNVLGPILEAVTAGAVAICEAFASVLGQISPIIDSITSLIQQLGDSISQIFQALSDTISTCGDTISQVLDSVADTINSVFTGIGDVITSIGESIKSVLDGIADIIESIGEAALNAGTGFENLANGVKTITGLNLIDMAASMAAVAKGIGDISANAEGLASAGTGMQQIASGTNLSASAFNTMAMGITMITTRLTAIGSTATRMMATLTHAITASVSSFSTMSNAINNTLNSVIASITSRAGAFSTAGSMLLRSLIMGMSTGIGSIEPMISTMMTNVTSSISNQAGVFLTAGATLMQMFSTGISVNAPIASNGVNAAISTMLSSITIQNALFRQAGINIMIQFASGIIMRSTSVIQMVNLIVTRALTTITSKRTTFMTAGVTLMLAFNSGLNVGGSGVLRTVTSMISSAVSAINSNYSEFVGAGRNLGDGLIAGIRSKIDEAWNAGYALGRAAVEGEKAGQRSHSPSKDTIEAGHYLGEGLIIGMRNMSGAVYNSGKEMGRNAVNSISSALDKVPSAIASDVDLEPTIRPVFDSSSINNEDIRIGATVEALLTKPVDSLSQIISDAQNAINASNLEVVTAINNLREDINALYSSDEQQEIALYVDSKKLATSLAKPMDRQLNVLAKRRV